MAKKFQLAVEAFKHKGFIRKIPDITRMIKSIVKKEYQPEFKNVLVPAAVILYLISPLDVIPDWIPVIGAMDDIALIALAIPMLMRETEKFIAWEVLKKSKSKDITEAEVIG